MQAPASARLMATAPIRTPGAVPRNSHQTKTAAAAPGRTEHQVASGSYGVVMRGAAKAGITVATTPLPVVIDFAVA